MKQVRGTINAVELLGWLGTDPDMRFTPGGTSVCRFRIATKHTAGRNEQGEREYVTDWTTVESWDRLAERCHTHLHKGSRVLVTGSLRTDNWEDRETGERRTKTYVRADNVIFLDTRPTQPAVTGADEEAEEELTEDIPF